MKAYESKFVLSVQKMSVHDVYEYLEDKTKVVSVNSGHSGWDTGKFFIANKDLKAFKKVVSSDGYSHLIANIIIPRGTKFFVSKDINSTHLYKCRAETVTVHSIFNKKGNEVKTAYSHHKRINKRTYRDTRTRYVAGKSIGDPKDFCHDAITCTRGIHFFFDVKTALAYNFT